MSCGGELVITRNHRHGSKVAIPESDVLILPSFFFIRIDSGQNRPFSVETGTDTIKTATETCQNGHRNGQRLPFFCFMWPCERKKKKREKEEEDEKAQKKWMEEE